MERAISLKSLVALLSNDSDQIVKILRLAGSAPTAEVSITRLNSSASQNQDAQEKILYSADGLEDTIGQVPMLAIPDARFIERWRRTIAFDDEDKKSDLVKSGAYHFLNDQPFDRLVQRVLHQACLDYAFNDRSFNQPIFQLIQDAVFTAFRKPLSVQLNRACWFRKSFTILVTMDEESRRHTCPASTRVTRNLVHRSNFCHNPSVLSTARIGTLFGSTERGMRPRCHRRTRRTPPSKMAAACSWLT